MLHKVAIIVAAIAVGGACMATDAIARGGGHGGSGQFGDRLGGSHFDTMGGGHFVISGGHLGGIAGTHFAGGLHHRSWFREANITTPGNFSFAGTALGMG
jgi:hypothetical protein